MKKPEVDNPHLDLVLAELAEMKATQAAILTRLERIDPTPPIASREPFPLLSTVFSIQDGHARYPMVVRGYINGRILVEMFPGEQPREVPIESVVEFAKCRKGEINSEEAYANAYSRMDPKSREFSEGRRKAQIAAATKEPVGPFEPKQERYGRSR